MHLNAAQLEGPPFEVWIHQGTPKISRNCVELRHGGAKLILDIVNTRMERGAMVQPSIGRG